ncbi:patatin-like phospholipase family protein [Parabacteroides chinchillae]
MKQITILIAFFFTLIHPLSAQKVGLVLSGGGAKGAAHLGVIKALEENGIPIDYITGTSAGAIVGSLYAMGYTPEEMLELMLSKEFSYWQSGTVEEKYIYYFKEPYPTPEFAHFSIDMSDSLQIKASFLPQSLINPIQMNQAFMALFSQATAKAGWNFDNLFVPFRCVASDIYTKKAIVFKNGDLGDAVRASMTFPFFFQPIWKDSVPLFDGGIYDNFPVNPMKDAFHPDFIFGSVVAGGNNKPSSNAYSQLETMIMQKTDYDVPEDEGMMIKFNFPNVSLLDFQKSKELMDIGYKRTMSIIDSIKQRVPRRVSLDSLNMRRKVYKENLPPLIFQNIYVTGVSESQRKYIESQLHRDINREFSMEEFKRAYFKMLTYSKIKEIMPHAVYNRKEKKFDLYLDVKMKEEVSVGFGGNVSSHQANQLYLGLGYQYLGRFAADVNTNFQVGNSFSGVMLNGRVYLQSRIPSYVNWQGVYSERRFSESQSLFYEDVVPSFIKQKELYMKLKLGFAFLTKAKAEIGFAYGQLNDYYLQTSKVAFPDASFDRSRYDLFSGSLSIEQNSLDSKQFPISGRQQFVIAQYVTGIEKYQPSTNKSLKEPFEQTTHSWLQMKGRWLWYQHLNNLFNMGYLAEMVISSKNLMNNYTSSVLQAPAFTPTPHSKIVFNEAFRANQYVAVGVSPILKFSKLLHLRLDMYGFAPLYEIKKRVIPINDTYIGVPYYGKFLHSFDYMGEAALVLQLPFLSISLYANGYSYPSKNFNVGLNIGYLIFNPKMLD